MVRRRRRRLQPAAPPLRADHIGASTFIEKGWSRISLGDYPAAETALQKALELSPNDLQAMSLLGWAQMHQEKYDDALLNFQRVLMKEPANALARINVGYICLKKRIFGEAIEHLSKAIRLDNDAKATLYAHYYLGLVYLEREMYDDAQTFFRKSLTLGPNLVEAYFELGRAHWLAGQQDDAKEAWRAGAAANKFNPWGKRCAEVLAKVEAGGEPERRELGIGNREPKPPGGCRFLVPCSRFPFGWTVGLLLSVTEHAAAQDSASRYDRGRFTIVAYKTDELLAKSLLASAVARDTFPGLPRPTQRVVIAIAPDHRRFREWIGPTAPEWGAAVAFPESSRIVMQGQDAGSDAGDPVEVLRHELAHLALHEALGDLPPRWFDEGYASYAANEVARDAVLGANLALLFRGMPPLDSLDAGFAGGSLRAEGSVCAGVPRRGRARGARTPSGA